MGPSFLSRTELKPDFGLPGLTDLLVLTYQHNNLTSPSSSSPEKSMSEEMMMHQILHRITSDLCHQRMLLVRRRSSRERWAGMLKDNLGVKCLFITYPDTGMPVELRPVTALPCRYHPIFPFERFNLIQTKIIDSVLTNSNNLVICSPTGSGKTVLFELAIVKLHMDVLEAGCSMDTVKIIYMAPMKALCSEKYEDWSNKFSCLDMKCRELTGDTENDDFFSLKSTNIILTTPEKWDSVTRRWKDNKSFVKQISLFLVDEIHTVNDSTRGATVEAVISRMKLVRQTLHSNTDHSSLRIVAVSATMANVQDIAEWVGYENSPAEYYILGDRYRPVPLTTHVAAYPDHKKGDFQFEYSLNYKLPDQIRKYSNNRPTLVFVSTRKGTQQAAQHVSTNMILMVSADSKIKLNSATMKLSDTVLKGCVIHGVAFHNAGLNYEDRRTIEDLFISGHLLVLIATSTLAVGVNLPAHLVIIKSTIHHTAHGYQDYTENEILQMIGRAGRPQFDTTATAVIMTKQSTKSKYETLLGGQQLIESSLHKNLIEHLNAEIVLGTIPCLQFALEWLKSTLLYVRITKNPKHYGLKGFQSRGSIDSYLTELLDSHLHMLERSELICIDSTSGSISSTEPGRLMARFLVSYDTMEKISQFTGEENQQQLIDFLSTCKELSDVQLRVSEKRVLNELNKSKNSVSIRYPMQGKIKTASMKISCLIQAQLGCLSVADFSLSQDLTRIFKISCQITKCLVELYSNSPTASSLYNAIILHKCMSSQLWENSHYMSKQLAGIGVKAASVFVQGGYHSFSKLQQVHPRDIEMMLGRHPPFGATVLNSVNHLPKYEMAIDQNLTKLDNLNCEVTVALRIANVEALKEMPTIRNHISYLLIYDGDNKVVSKHKIFDSSVLRVGVWTAVLKVKRAMRDDILHISFLSLTWVGLDISSKFTPRYTGLAYTEFRRSLQQQKLNGGSSSNGKGPSCKHRCANKKTCAHACCKQSGPTNVNKSIQSYLQPPANAIKSRQPVSESGTVNHQAPGRPGLMPQPISRQSSVGGLAQPDFRSSGSNSRMLDYQYNHNGLKSTENVNSTTSNHLKPRISLSYEDDLDLELPAYDINGTANKDTDLSAAAHNAGLTGCRKPQSGSYPTISSRLAQYRYNQPTLPAIQPPTTAAQTYNPASYYPPHVNKQRLDEPSCPDTDRRLEDDLSDPPSPPLSLPGYTQYDWNAPTGIQVPPDVEGSPSHQSSFSYQRYPQQRRQVPNGYLSQPATYPLGKPACAPSNTTLHQYNPYTTTPPRQPKSGFSEKHLSAGHSSFDDDEFDEMCVQALEEEEMRKTVAVAFNEGNNSSLVSDESISYSPLNTQTQPPTDDNAPGVDSHSLHNAERNIPKPGQPSFDWKSSSTAPSRSDVTAESTIQVRRFTAVERALRPQCPQKDTINYKQAEPFKSAKGPASSRAFGPTKQQMSSSSGFISSRALYQNQSEDQDISQTYRHIALSNSDHYKTSTVRSETPQPATVPAGRLCRNEDISKTSAIMAKRSTVPKETKPILKKSVKFLSQNIEYSPALYKLSQSQEPTEQRKRDPSWSNETLNSTQPTKMDDPVTELLAADSRWDDISVQSQNVPQSIGIAKNNKMESWFDSMKLQKNFNPELLNFSRSPREPPRLKDGNLFEHDTNEKRTGEVCADKENKENIPAEESSCEVSDSSLNFDSAISRRQNFLNDIQPSLPKKPKVAVEASVFRQGLPTCVKKTKTAFVKPMSNNTPEVPKSHRSPPKDAKENSVFDSLNLLMQLKKRSN